MTDAKTNAVPETLTVALKGPLTVNGEAVTELTLRRPRMASVIAAEEDGLGSLGGVIRLLADASGVPYADLCKIKPRALSALKDAVAPILRPTRATVPPLPDDATEASHTFLYPCTVNGEKTKTATFTEPDVGAMIEAEEAGHGEQGEMLLMAARMCGASYIEAQEWHPSDFAEIQKVVLKLVGNA